MKKHKIFHVMALDKFIPSFIGLLQNESYNCHFFHVIGDSQKYPLNSANNVMVRDKRLFDVIGLFQLLVGLNRADKVLLHGLFDFKVIALLFLQPWLLRKCYWLIWGADLYFHLKYKEKLVWVVKEVFRKQVIRNIGNLVTYVPGDVNLARQWYGAKGKFHECIMYPSNVFAGKVFGNTPKRTITIQLGNSAVATNKHLEAIDILSCYAGENILVYAPLSYGDKNYADSVIAYGKKKLGCKFVPITEIMPLDEYNRFLANIDIAIFNHERQQAMGNIITLLGLGKKVYLRKNISSWQMFSNMGIAIYKLEDFSLDLISQADKKNNVEIVTRYFSRENLMAQLGKIFEEL